MTLYDVTLPLRETMVVYPGDPELAVEPVFRIDSGDSCNVSLLHMGTHLGTHIDPPLHYLAEGAAIDEFPLELMVGSGLVLDLRSKPAITAADLAAFDLHGADRVLLKTDNSPKLRLNTFSKAFVSLSLDGAAHLIECGVKLVGIDYYSIEDYESDGAVHKLLLSASVFIVEGLNLRDVPAGPCRIYCFPLRIVGGDGSPARVVVEV
jgi:arylformamidase